MPCPTARRLLRALQALSFTILVSLAAQAADGAGPNSQAHTVYRGQTLGMIAKRYNVSIAAICSANGIRRNRPIFPGQRLVIPRKKSRARAANRTSSQMVKGRDRGLDAKQAGGRSRTATRSAKTSSRRSTRQGSRSLGDRYAARPNRRGYVKLRGRLRNWEGLSVRADGSIPPDARDGFEGALASWRTGKTERIHGRLIRMLTRVSDHFGGQTIVIISGFRPPSKEQFTARSKHNIGRAVDFRIPGVPNEAIRDFCRGLPMVGVGYYPNSSFVHLDVRERSTYWVDFSGPGEAPRYATPSGEDPAKVRPKKGRGAGAGRGRAANNAKTSANPK